MYIQVKSVSFYSERETVSISTTYGNYGTSSASSRVNEMVRIRFKMNKENMELEGKLNIPKDEYIANINNLEDYIEELLLNKSA